MRAFLGALAVGVMLVAGLAGPANAQAPETLPLHVEGIDTSTYPDVSVVVSVPRELVGKALTSKSFTVNEDGMDRPVEATAVPTDGLQVVLLLDTSGSMEGAPIAAAKDAAQSFLDAMPDSVDVAVVSFNDTPEVRTPFTTDATQAENALSGIETGRDTALYDALAAGAALFKGEENDRRILVVLSDGGDTASSVTLEDAIDVISAADLGFYVVELESPENDSASLQRLVAATGGQVVAAEDPEALAAVFDEVASKIVNQYELHYTSEATGEATLDIVAAADGVIAAASTLVPLPDITPVTTHAPEPAPTMTVIEVLPPSLRRGSVVSVGFLESTTALWLGSLAVFLGLLGALLFLGAGRGESKRFVSRAVKHRLGESRGGMLAGVAAWVTSWAERVVDRGGVASSITRLLEQAGIQLRPGELVVVAFAGALAAAVVAMLVSNGWTALLVGVLVLFGVWMWMRRQAAKRQKAFAEQLPDLLQLVSSSIRSGFGMMQAMDAVSREMPSPAGVEFQRVKTEVQLGRNLNDSLTAMAGRVSSEDFQWVVEAIQIHNEVGGDLADILDSVLGTVRDRIRVRRRIHTLSAEGRMSGLVLAALPFVLVIALFFFSPGYLDVLVTTHIGRLLVAVGLTLMAIGALWIRRITALRF